MLLVAGSLAWCYTELRKFINESGDYMLQAIRRLSKTHLAVLGICLLAVGSAVYFFLAQRASRHAAELFNYYMAKQQVLAGTVTAEELRADIWGNVYFKNLTWDSPEDERLLDVPEGRIKIKPKDIILRIAGIDTVQEVELRGAYIHLGFDDKMRLDILQNKKMAEEILLDEVPPEKRHLQIKGKLPNIRLILHDTVLSAEYKKRHFILNDVDAAVQIHEHQKLELHLAAGRYGGSIAGKGLNIDGTCDLQGEQKTNINICLYDVIPDSLGMKNVNDAMTVTGQMTGSLKKPVIDGALALKELHLNDLYFTNINGTYHYENALITFQDVTGSIFGGTFDAIGLYHFDNRYYKIDVDGKDLMASLAAKSSKINTSVALKMKFRNEGPKGNNLVYGSFSTGKGTYLLVPFLSLRGSFSDQSGELAFSNVEIETKVGTFESDVFKIVDGRLQLGEIFLANGEGRRIRVR